MSDLEYPATRRSPAGAAAPAAGTRRASKGATVAGDGPERTTVARASPDDDRLPTSYYVVLVSVLALLAFGLLMVFSASAAVRMFSGSADAYIYLRPQALSAVAGLAVLWVLSRCDYRRWRVWFLLGAVVSAGLLVAVHVPGVGQSSNGATRWIGLGFISLQPSEVAKLAVVGVAAHFLSLPRAQEGSTSDKLLPLLLVVGVICGLILVQPDLGTAILVVLAVLALLWVAGLRARDWVGLVAVGTALAGVFIMTADYRRERFLAFLSPFNDAKHTGYQLVQSLYALGSGGLFGVGPGRSVQKFSYLPEAHTDMIFAVAAFRIARRCGDPFGRYLAIGCTIVIAGQAFLNMGGVMSALPLTGVPLPFISFGRTNLLVVLAAVGIILSVARHGPAVSAPVPPDLEPQEWTNVAHLDRRRRDGGPRRTRPGSR
jgi:cell division protein FtsW